VLVVLVVLLVVFVAGFFLDWFEIVLIILPLLAPVIKLAGLDTAWFLILVALMLQTSFLTPPVGFSLFYLKGAVPKVIVANQGRHQPRHLHRRDSLCAAANGHGDTVLRVPTNDFVAAATDVRRRLSANRISKTHRGPRALACFWAGLPAICLGAAQAEPLSPPSPQRNLGWLFPCWPCWLRLWHWLGSNVTVLF